VQLSSHEPERIEQLASVVRHERSDDREIFTVTDADEFVRELVGSGLAFHDLTVRGATLEEAFLALTESLVADESPRKAGQAA
jgi:ABC-2 type transport system ATP-binding protein